MVHLTDARFTQGRLMRHVPVMSLTSSLGFRRCIVKFGLVLHLDDISTGGANVSNPRGRLRR